MPKMPNVSSPGFDSVQVAWDLTWSQSVASDLRNPNIAQLTQPNLPNLLDPGYHLIPNVTSDLSILPSPLMSKYSRHIAL
jgi:hypothetical protein